MTAFIPNVLKLIEDGIYIEVRKLRVHRRSKIYTTPPNTCLWFRQYWQIMDITNCWTGQFNKWLNLFQEWPSAFVKYMFYAQENIFMLEKMITTHYLLQIMRTYKHYFWSVFIADERFNQVDQLFEIRKNGHGLFEMLAIWDTTPKLPYWWAFYVE